MSLVIIELKVVCIEYAKSRKLFVSYLLSKKKYIKEWVWKNVQDWVGQSSSTGGIKEVLIKSVALAVLTYSIPCFRVP